jgi:nucleoside-diphosphate-sugar epimerase
MRIFVTGATGVIGRRVVPLLTDAGHQVTAVGRTPEKRRVLEEQGAGAVDADLFDAAAMRRVLEGHDAVVNLATHMPSSSTKMLFRRYWQENDHIRREGSSALVDAALAAGVGRFLQESFAPIYEDGGDRWLDENAPVRPTAYNRTVLDAERSALHFAASGGRGVVLRFAAFYGPDSRVLHDMVNIVRKGWAPLPGEPSAYISSIAHDDAATAVVATLDGPSGIYNVSDDEPVTRREWMDTLAAALGVRPPKLLPAWLTRLGGSTMELLARSVRMSNAKLRSVRGWAPRYPSVRDGWAAFVSHRPSMGLDGGAGAPHSPIAYR